MNKLYTFLLFTGLTCLSSFSQGLDGIIVDKIPVPNDVISQDTALRENAYTYRVFVDMATGYKLNSVFGTALNPLIFRTSTYFYNNVSGFTQPYFTPVPGLDAPAFYDTWIAFGWYSTAPPKHIIPLAMDTEDGTADGLTGTSSMVSIGVDPLTDFDKFFGFERGPSADGSVAGWNPNIVIWYSAGGVSGYGDSNTICIGQFTTDGEFSMELHLGIGGPGGAEEWVLRQIHAEDQYIHNELAYPNEPPTVTLLSPVEGQSLQLDEVLTLAAEAQDSDGTIASVSFSFISLNNRHNQIITLTEAPYTFDWQIKTNNIAKIYAVAEDSNFGRDTAMVNVTINSIPEIALTAPADGAAFNAGTVITLEAAASDPDGSIAKVEFFINDAEVAEDTEAPYSYDWTAEAGVKEIMAVATDNLGTTATSETVTITVSVPGNNNPAVSIAAPPSDAIFNTGDSILLQVTASDPDAGDFITKVEYLVNDNKIGESTEPPFDFMWFSVGGGTLGLKAKAYDNKGGSTISAEVLIKLNTGPTVTITNPSESIEIQMGEQVVFQVDANDNDGVAIVQFLFNGQVGFEDSDPPYEYAWTADSLGITDFTARAIDALGASSTTQAITVEVTPAVGIQSLERDKLIKVYPNPASGMITIELLREKPSRDLYYSITNMLGQRYVYDRFAGEKHESLDISSYPDGMYLLKVWSADKSDPFQQSMIIVFER